MTVPFLLCLPAEKVMIVTQQLDDYQKRYHGGRFKKPTYLEEKPEPAIINAPDYQEEQEINTLKEMSLPAHSHRLRKEEK